MVFVSGVSDVSYVSGVSKIPGFTQRGAAKGAAIVLHPEVGPLFTTAPRRCLVVWNADRNAGPPPELLTFVKMFARADSIEILEPQQELLNYHHARKIRLGTALVSSANRLSTFRSSGG
jgi:hypothetical protein